MSGRQSTSPLGPISGLRASHGPQQQQQLLESAQKSDNTSANASITSTTSSKFDAIRNCAVSMFKQQAKDLTNVSQLTTTVEAMEGARQKLVRKLADLRKLVALDESKAQMLSQRVQRKKATLENLKTAVVTLESEKQLNASVPESLGSNVFRLWEDVSTTYSIDGDAIKPAYEAVDPADEHRFPSLEEVHRNIATHRTRCSLLDSLLQQIQETSSVPSGLGPLLLEWSADPDYANLTIFHQDLTGAADPSQGPLESQSNQPIWQLCPPWIAAVEKKHREASMISGKLGLEGPVPIKDSLERLRKCLAECTAAAEHLENLERQHNEAASTVSLWQANFSRAVESKLADDRELFSIADHQIPYDQPSDAIFVQHAFISQTWAAIAADYSTPDEAVVALQARLEELVASHRSLEEAEIRMSDEVQAIVADEESAAAMNRAAATTAEDTQSLAQQCRELHDHHEAAERFTAAVMKLLRDTETDKLTAAKSGRTSLEESCNQLLLGSPQTDELIQSVGSNDLISFNQTDDLLAKLFAEVTAELSSLAQCEDAERLRCDEHVASLQLEARLSASIR